MEELPFSQAIFDVKMSAEKLGNVVLFVRFFFQGSYFLRGEVYVAGQKTNSLCMGLVPCFSVMSIQNYLCRGATRLTTRRGYVAGQKSSSRMVCLL